MIEKIERKLGIGVIVTNVALIAGFFFFAAGMKSTGIDSGWEEEVPWVKIAATFLGLIAVMVVTVIAQNRIVNFTKEINPEKKGSVYDLKFQKTWIASCDEAEQLQIPRGVPCLHRNELCGARNVSGLLYRDAVLEFWAASAYDGTFVLADRRDRLWGGESSHDGRTIRSLIRQNVQDERLPQ